MSDIDLKVAQVKLAELAHNILQHACPNGGIQGDWHTFVIETHCVAWRVTAKKMNGHWVIRSAISEDC